MSASHHCCACGVTFDGTDAYAAHKCHGHPATPILDVDAVLRDRDALRSDVASLQAQLASAHEEIRILRRHLSPIVVTGVETRRADVAPISLGGAPPEVIHDHVSTCRIFYFPGTTCDGSCMTAEDRGSMR